MNPCARIDKLSWNQASPTDKARSDPAWPYSTPATRL